MRRRGSKACYCAVRVLALMLCAVQARAQEASPALPTVFFDCSVEGCSPVTPVPDSGQINLVILNAPSVPSVSVASKKLRQCDAGKSAWCVDNVPVSGLIVSRKDSRKDNSDRAQGSSQKGDDALGVGDLRVETSRIRVRLAINVLVIGPDISEVSDRTRLVGGELEIVGTDEYFEDVVLVGTSNGYRCSGVLISPRHVLTAAHCLPATAIGLGNSMADALSVPVTKSTSHPTADVAVLEIASRAAITPRPRRRDVTSPAPLGVARMLGFGVSDQVRLTGFGRKRSLTVSIDGWGCSKQRARELGCTIGRELMLRDEQGNDTCLGDSGGPLFERTPDGWQLIGITSRGIRPKKRLCGEGGIYSRVDVLAAWIDEAIK